MKHARRYLAALVFAILIGASGLARAEEPRWFLCASAGVGTPPGEQGETLMALEVLGYRYMPYSLLVGARLGSFTEPRLINIGTEHFAELTDIGPVAGVHGRAGRFLATASAGPVLTLVEPPEHGFDDHTDLSLTAGLAVDAGLSFHIGGPLALGIHGAANVNPEMSTVAAMLRLEAALIH